MEHVVGIGGFAVAGDQSDVIKTFALATCVGLVFYSVRKRVMGMAHIQLPNSRAGTKDLPSRFADTAPGFMMQEMMKFGVTKGEMLISLYGGIDSQGQNDCFKIGEKNLSIIKQSIKQLGLVYSDVDTGGRESRTLVAHVSSGIVEVIKRPMIGSGPVKPPPGRPPMPGFGGAKSPPGRPPMPGFGGAKSPPGRPPMPGFGRPFR